MTIKKNYNFNLSSCADCTYKYFSGLGFLKKLFQVKFDPYRHYIINNYWLKGSISLASGY